MPSITLVLKSAMTSTTTLEDSAEVERRSLVQCIKGPWFELRNERVLTLGFFDTNGASTG